MIIALTFALAAAPLQGMPMKPMRAPDALALFQRICVDTSLDPARFDAVLAAEPDSYQKQLFLPGSENRPGGKYVSERAEVSLAAIDDPPPELPSRICGVLARADAPIDHAALVAGMTLALSLPTGQTRIVDGGRYQNSMLTLWNVPAGTDTLRYRLITRPEPTGGPHISISVTKSEGKFW